jgi:ribosomal peptide maturation radical SAM protein 1
VKSILNKQSIKDIPAIIYHNNGESVMTQGNQIVENLDALPYPDYDDYFDQLKQIPFASSTCSELLMETSRGCWWGERSQCRFCGLNGGSISFRSKSENRVINELQYLIEKYAKKYNVTRIAMVDNILDMKYFKKLLPELKDRCLPVQLIYEVKANLSKEQVQILYEAGIHLIGPGIESLNTHILKLMAKGVSVLQNIQLLKNCEQFGIFPRWNILTGFPGENIEDYRQMTNLIYKITHLPSPFVNTRFELERFSPYFANPEKYGIVNVRPEGAYQFIYPFENSSIFNLAYFFQFDYRDDVRPPNYEKELAEAVYYWKECYATNESLYSIITSPSALLIEDGRSNAVIPQIVLESAQKDIYEYCDNIRSFSSVFSYIRNEYSDYPIRARDIKDFLDEMVALNFMVSENDKYLSLAVPVEEKFSTEYNSVLPERLC